MRFKSVAYLSLILLAISCIGCGSSEPELVAVQGVVQIDGKPADGIMVRFIPNVVDETVKAPSSQAITDADGKFELYTTDNKPGAFVGKHKVALVDTLIERVAQGESSSKPLRLSSKFSQLGAIEVDIKGPQSDLVLEATSK